MWYNRYRLKKKEQFKIDKTLSALCIFYNKKKGGGEMRDVTLYNISQDFEYISELLERDVLEDGEKERLQAMLVEKINQQSREIITFQIEKQANIEVLKKEIQRLQSLKKAEEESIEKFKDRLTENMRKLKCTKIATPLGNITLSLDGVNKSVALKENANINDIPEEFVKTTKELKKTEIKKALENGVIINGVELVETPQRVKFMLSKEAKDIQSEKVGE